MSMKLIRDVYKVPAKRGMKIKMLGRPATILSERNCRLRIEFDDEPGNVYTAHPTWEIEYPPQKPVPDDEKDPENDPVRHQIFADNQ